MEAEMQVLEARVLVTGILLLLTAVSGVAVTAMGRPLNIAVSTVHKLLAVSAVVLAVLAVLSLLKVSHLETGAILLVAAVGLMLVVLFATGAFLSADRQPAVVLKAAHAAAPFLALFLAFLLTLVQLRR
jgi:hypothetical protein